MEQQLPEIELDHSLFVYYVSVIINQIACCIYALSSVILGFSSGLILDQYDFFRVRVLSELANDVSDVDFLSFVCVHHRNLPLRQLMLEEPHLAVFVDDIPALIDKIAALIDGLPVLVHQCLVLVLEEHRLPRFVIEVKVS